MSQTTRQRLMREYDEWEAERAALSEAEERGGPPPTHWHESDDAAVELLRSIAEEVRQESRVVLYRIRGTFVVDGDQHLFWSNTYGWVGQDDADIFTARQQAVHRLPFDGEWVRYDATFTEASDGGN